MKREQLITGLEQIKSKIKKLKTLRFKYFIHGKYITGHGQIELIETPEALMKAFNYVKNQFKDENFIDEIANELGFEVGVVDSQEEQLYLGYTLEEWTEEFQEKAKEIKTQIQISQLEKAKEKFKGYRTEDEKFAEDANKFGTLFAELGITGEESQQLDANQLEDDDQKLLEK